MTAAPKAPRAPSSGAAPAIKRDSALKRVKELVHAAKADGLARDARIILVHAAVYMDLNGWCFPSATSLAEDTGYTEKSVRKALRELREAGIIVVLPPPAWKLAVPATPGANVPKGGRLPMMLLWPSASRAARIAALGALAAKPHTATNAGPPAGPYFVTVDGKETGPYQAQDIERFARAHDSAAWIVRNATDSFRLDGWYWFGAHFPRAPQWIRGE